MIKAIIFDLDGTIIDTESPWYDALQISYQQYNQELPLEIYAKCVGTSLDAFDPYQYIVTELNVELDVEEFKLLVRKHYDQLMEQQQLRPGVKQLLEQAKQAGVKLAVASSSPRNWVESHIAKLNIAPYFEILCTADDVQQVKPDPALYLLALERLQVEASEAVAIEDSPNGAKAAAFAKLASIVTTNSLTATLPFETPHYKCDRLDQITLSEINQIAMEQQRLL